MVIKIVILFSVIVCLFVKPGHLSAQAVSGIICNPLNLNYRYCLDTPSRREAADPTAINFKGEYYLFASKSGGYWHSIDLVSWDLITTKDLPLEDYAPTAVVVGDTVYFMASSEKPAIVIYKTSDPKSGKWMVANPAFPIGMIDPDLFLDDDGRLYLYYGCSNINPISVVELNRKTLMPVTKPIACINSNSKDHGWERFGDYNEKPDAPWIEGAWMTKYMGKYYLQYASPATEYKSYADGMYVSDSPTGPFKLATNNPYSYKPEGFIASAGHSSTFQDNYGNYWRISTMTISVNHRYERRLGLFPAFFDKSGNDYAYTGFGDYPFRIPHTRISTPGDISTQFMLLSYAKPVTVSSALKGFPARYAVDENIRTWWSALTGNTNEWITVDLKHKATVNAIQLNFADQNSDIYGRPPGLNYQYKIEYSDGNKLWKTLQDRSANNRDAPHDFIELSLPIKARYIRVTNVHIPGGKFAISGLRVFGKADGTIPQEVKGIHAVREMYDRCKIKLKWVPGNNAIGYNIRYGVAPDKLFQNYQVYTQNHIDINSLNSNSSYYFVVDSFNESGIKKGSKPIFVK